MRVELNPVDKNQNIVTIGAVTLYFSYAACIAFDSNRIGGDQLFNPKYRKHSTTTTRHAGNLGVKGYADAESEDAFNRALALQLREGSGLTE